MDRSNLPHILYVDDEPENLNSFTAAFRRNFVIHTASNSDEALDILKDYMVHVIISDQKMPGTPGVQLLEEAVKKYPLPARILISAYPDKEVLDIAVQKCHIFDYVQKPWNFDHFKDLITAAYNDYIARRTFKSTLVERELNISKLDKNIEKVTEISD